MWTPVGHHSHLAAPEVYIMEVANLHAVNLYESLNWKKKKKWVPWVLLALIFIHLEKNQKQDCYQNQGYICYYL